MTEIYKRGPVELRCGDWCEVLADVAECDAVICDPPYSAVTHSSTRTGKFRGTSTGHPIGFGALDASWCDTFARHWSPRSGWMVMFSDNVGWAWHNAAADGVGRKSFPRIPVIQTGARPRRGADGPSVQGEYLFVSRPRQAEYLGNWSGIPGWYKTVPVMRCSDEYTGTKGAKRIALMRQIVRHYTRPGQLIVDPCAGGATTLLAAAVEGRRCIGAEIDPQTYAKAVRRLEVKGTLWGF